jgi:hypothetical protein
MKRSGTHKRPIQVLLSLLLALFCIGSFSSCKKDVKKMNERVTLRRSDKIPYGTWYAFENLSHLFPDAKIEVNKTSPEQYNSWVSGFEDPAVKRPRSAYIIISPTVWMDENELQAIFSYVGRGNHVFISAIDFSNNLLDSLKLLPAFGSGFSHEDDSLTVSVVNPETVAKTYYTYPGIQLDNYLVKIDTNFTNVIGYNSAGRPNFVRFTYESGGSISIHFAPAALTNFFLLHKDNKSYYDNVISYLPKNIRLIRWDEYFRYHTPGSNNFSAFGWLLAQPGLAWAIMLLLTLFLLIYLFESKRKQRIIPTIVPPRNASLDFVKTIGRLYFQRRDNKNLTGKMIVHFLDHVRTRYNIHTSVLDDHFENRLAYKSGIEYGHVKDLMAYIRLVEARPMIDDETLMEFNRRLENFYKRS